MPENNKLRYDSYTESPKGHLNNITFTASVKKLGDVYAEATPITALTSHGDFVGGIAGVTAMGRQLGVDVGFSEENPGIMLKSFDGILNKGRGKKAWGWQIAINGKKLRRGLNLAKIRNGDHLEIFWGNLTTLPY